MKKTIVFVLIAFGVGLAVGWIGSTYHAHQQDRFYMVTTSKGIVYQIDKQTGDTWEMVDGEKRLIEKESGDEEFFDYPVQDILERVPDGVIKSNLVNGVINFRECYPSGYELRATFHNDSLWEVRSAMISFIELAEDGISPKGGDQPSLFYNIKGVVPPLGDGVLSADIPDRSIIPKSCTWIMLGAVGVNKTKEMRAELNPQKPFDPDEYLKKK